MLKFALFVCLLAAFTFPIKSDGVENCYQCSSITHEGCGDPFDKDKIKSSKCDFMGTDATTYACLKVTAEISGVEVIMRSCTPKSDNMCDAFENTPGLKSCNFCETDDCNSGALHTVSITLLAFAVLAYFMNRF